MPRKKNQMSFVPFSVNVLRSAETNVKCFKNKFNTCSDKKTI